MENQLELVANNKLVIGKVDGGPLGTFQIQKTGYMSDSVKKIHEISNGLIMSNLVTSIFTAILAL